ncbi:hypothetical protein, partial [Trinickia mobilis]|uniref:hypothetical protein n=1 Tax=Trinickia mobilis TaxID=2816356 RepID=UPI001A8D1DAB
MKTLDAQGAALSPEQVLREELVGRLMRERLGGHAGGGISMLSNRTPELQPQDRPGRLPLSYAQERLWVLEQMGLPGGAYTIPGAVR